MHELRPELVGTAIGGWIGLAAGLVLMALGHGGLFYLPSPGEAYAAGVLAGATGGMGLGAIFSAIREEAASKVRAGEP
jgi:hypothetical protein